LITIGYLTSFLQEITYFLLVKLLGLVIYVGVEFEREGGCIVVELLAGLVNPE
jgi:hypothetical protein